MVNDSKWEQGMFIKLPEDFNDMLKYGEKLSEEFPFVRIDFFYSNSKLYLGEMTFTPGSGFEQMNLKIQEFLGKRIELKI